jgi:hypothetical protein
MYHSSKNISGLIIVCAVAMAVAFSCGKNTKQSKYSVDFDTIHIDDTFQFDTLKQVFKYNVKADFTYPENCSDTAKLHKLQSIFIAAVLSENFSSLTPQQAVDSFHRQEETRFFSDMRYDEDEPADTATWELYYHVSNNITGYNNNIISFTVELSGYTGGAHGYHGVAGYVYDLSTDGFITEDDFAGINYRQNMAAVITGKIKEIHGIEPDGQLDEFDFWSNEIEPNGNFSIDSRGITYYFNEYEIAPYSSGMTAVFIPFNELVVYISDSNPLTNFFRK